MHEVQQREAEKARKRVGRGGGEEARRQERGKAKATTITPGVEVGEERDEEAKKLSLVIFACRHVFHRVCLDPELQEGRPGRGEMYKCPICRST